tara:strand:+ start:153 stop:257 length:105 start_codon:yes stop_codon:yes gene_type:complete
VAVVQLVQQLLTQVDQVVEEKQITLVVLLVILLL